MVWDSELSEFSEYIDTEDETEQLANTRDNDDLPVNPITYKK